MWCLKAFLIFLPKHKTETKNVNREIYDLEHGLQSPNEGINPMCQIKYALAVNTKKFGNVSDFSALKCKLFLLWESVVRDLKKSCLWLKIYL